MKYLVLLLLISCSLYQGTASDWYKQKNREEIGKYQDKDFVDHFVRISDDYIRTSRKDHLTLSWANKKYLERLYRNIVDSNEILIKGKQRPRFTIIKSRQPFCFSLPSGNFFLSSKLLINYIKHEEILVAALTHEIIRSHLNIYKKKVIVPTGNIEVEKLISLTRIDLSLKMRVNKWTYFAMKRAGYDGFGYMLWVQIQNKNALDFLFQLGDLHNISKEEYLFKSFVAEEMKNENFQAERKMHSSRGFYSLLRQLKSQNV